MPAFVALLRAVNVGTANRVPMQRFRSLLSDLGYRRVVTFLNSGNAVFDASDAPPGKHAADIAAALRTHLNVDVAVIVKSARELADIVDECRIATDADVHSRLLVAFVQGVEALTELAAMAALVRPPERFEVGTQAAYLYCARGIRQSKAMQALSSRAGKTVTLRNFATVLRLRGLVERERASWPTPCREAAPSGHGRRRGGTRARALHETTVTS